MLISDEIMEMLINGLMPKGHCGLIHPGYTCNQKAFAQAAAGIRAVTKMYLIVHLVPFLIFKRKKVRQQYPSLYLDPTRRSKSLSWDCSSRSCSQEPSAGCAGVRSAPSGGSSLKCYPPVNSTLLRGPEHAFCPDWGDISAIGGQGAEGLDRPIHGGAML